MVATQSSYLNKKKNKKKKKHNFRKHKTYIVVSTKKFLHNAFLKAKHTVIKFKKSENILKRLSLWVP